MPLFTRRRLQFFLDDLSSVADSPKIRDLLNRIENKRVEQALPAEMELSLLWAIKSLGEVEIEPHWWGADGRPDVYTEALFRGKPAAIEIAAASDNSISSEEVMDRVACVIMDHANSIAKGVGGFLYFRFSAQSGYSEGVYFRKALAPKDYTISNDTKDKIEEWILSGRSQKHRIRIVEEGLDVEIEHSKHKQTRFHNIFCQVPPEAYTLEKNPLFELLSRKSTQLRGANTDALRLIFLADVGSTLLRAVGTSNENYHSHYRKSGSQIISHFVASFQGRLDGVVVFAPRREQFPVGRHSPKWAITVFPRDDLSEITQGLNSLAALLPAPRFEGYQARSLFRQGAFSPKEHGWYLGMSVDSNRKEMKVRVSARAFLDLLAGRITVDQFRHFTGERDGEGNLFKRWLDLGFTLVKVEMDARKIDEDDDHLVLHFEDDPAARLLRNPS